ncbi:hypothetical protein OPV22_034196 [Ensete ventricosum]|uniref:BHLH domain-containing protein n=1 Tax=Ensete ventricosum TaxID=4639 RepID=A0AAV8PTX1_ENSVE|nr:hypothetical protein OPV22_034196 [Ensete ventricosum]
MYRSHPVPPLKDLNLPYPSAGPFSGQRTEEPVSDLLVHHHHQQQQHMSSGLLRYRSAPSSLLGEVCEDFLPVTASGLETETMFARFLAPDPRDEVRDKPSGVAASSACHSSPHVPPPPLAPQVNEQQSRGFSAAPHTMFHLQQQQPQQMPSHSSVESSFPVSGSSSSLIRQSSSPAGFLSHLNANSGYGMMRGMGGFRDGSGFMMDGTHRTKGFSSRQNSVLSHISEMGSEEAMEASSPRERSGDGRSFISAFSVASWDESSLFNNSFSGLERGRESEEKITAGLISLEPQTGEERNHASGVPHQLSLPKSSPVMTAIEKFLQIHDAVPFKIRAKRGCATHPRSIAERVRRTRISERMKKLQELVPNMDKQTNTADMLDLALDYINNLQKQVKALSESRARCSCSASTQKPY